MRPAASLQTERMSCFCHLLEALLTAGYFTPGSLLQSGRVICFTGQSCNYRPVSPSGEREPWAFDQGCRAADWPKEGRRGGEDKEKRERRRGGAGPLGLSRLLIVVQL